MRSAIALLLWVAIALAAVIWSEAYASVTVTVNGSSYVIPQKNEKGWGDSVTSWIQAISANTVQPSGGNFTLTADLDFGASFGVKSAYIKSRSSNPASAGLLRLAVADSLGWRNNANSADLLLSVNGSDQLQFNGVLIPSLASSSFLDNGFRIVNSVDGTKKIAFSATGITTATTRTVTMPDANVDLGNLTNSNIASGAGIVYSKLSLGTSILNSDIGTSAAIARSKIATGTLNRIVVNDGSTGALLDAAAITAARALISDANGIPTQSAVTSTELSLLSGLTGTVLTSGNTVTGISGKTFVTPTVDVPTFTQVATPANPAASSNKLYFKSDNHLYELTSAGAETQIDAASASTSFDSSITTFNLGLASTVAASAMTIRLKQKDGATDPANTGSSKVTIGFRDVTVTNGKYSLIDTTAALSVVVPSGATLGQTSAVASYVWIYALNDAGTTDLCISGGDPFDDSNAIAATQISAGATSGFVLYCTGTHSGAKAIRLIGRCLETEATAGTWASNCTELDTNPVPRLNMGPWVAGGAITITGTTTSPTKGVVVTDTFNYRRVGKAIEFFYNFNQTSGGASGSGDYLFLLPNSLTVDTTVLTTNATIYGNANQVGATIIGSGGDVGGGAAFSAQAYMANSTQFKIWRPSSAVYNSGGIGFSGALSFSIRGEIPIVGWFNYGP